MQKQLLLACLFFLGTTGLWSQTVPQGINYQAVLRDVNNQNQVLANKPTEVTFSILNGSPLGTLVYQEKHDTSSNGLGQLILVIGQGMPVGTAQFADIDWPQGPKFLKIEATVDGNTTLLGTPQLQSVPYALAANPVGTAGGDLSGQYPDPNVVKIQGNPISSTPPSQPGQVLKWNGSEWVPAPDNDTGDNWGTQVAHAILPVTGNGSTVPLTIQNESITTAHIQNGTIQPDDIANGAINAAKLNSMGADTNQLLQWNGAAWVPADRPSFWGHGDCNDDSKIFALNDRVVGLGGCPSDSVFFHIRNNEKKEVGAQIDVVWSSDETLPATGLKVNVSGSGSNDGVLVFARNAEGTSRGMTVVAEDNADTVNTEATRALALTAAGASETNDGLVVAARNGKKATGISIEAIGGSDDNTGVAIFSGGNIEPIGSSNQNYGLYAKAKDRPSNDNLSADKRDIAVYAVAEDQVNDWAGYFTGNVRMRDNYVDGGRVFLQYGTGNYWRLYPATSAGQVGTGYYGTNDLLLGPDATPKFAFTTGGSFFQASDATLKENISELPSMSALVSRLRPVAYNFKDDISKRPTMGFISQEVESLFPELVHKVKNEDGREISLLNYSALSVVAIKAIQEQQATIESQQQELDALKTELADIKALLKTVVADKGKAASEK